MNYENLTNKAVMRTSNFARAESGESNYSLFPGDPRKGEGIEQNLKSGRIASTPMLEKAREIATETNVKIKDIVAHPKLKPAQRHEFIQQLKSTMVMEMESVVVAEIKKNFKHFDAEKTKYDATKSASNYTESTSRLLRLHEAELLHKFDDEAQSMATLMHMQKAGYDEVTALVVGSKSKRCNAKMKEMFADVPSHLATPDGIQKIDEATDLLELRPGQFQVHYQSNDKIVGNPDVFDVGDLLVPEPEYEFADIVK